MGQLHDKLTALMAVIARLPGRNWGRTDDRIMFEDGVHLVPATAGNGLRDYEALALAPNGEDGRGAHGDGDTRTFDTIAAVLHHAVELRDMLEHPTLRALLRVLHERERQVVVEGFNTDHDDQYHDGKTLSYAAASYLGPVWTYSAKMAPHGAALTTMAEPVDPTEPPVQWPWDRKWWKPKTLERDLERGAALAVAALERHYRDIESEEFKKLPQDDVRRMTHEILAAAGYKGGVTDKAFKEAMKATKRGILRMARAK